MKNKVTRWLCAGVCAALVLGSTACGSGSHKSAATNNFMASDSYSGAADYGYVMEEAAPEAYREYSNGSQAVDVPDSTSVVATSDRKLIRNVSLEIETKEFDGFLTSVTEQVNALNGYIENMNTYNGSRYASQTPVRYSNLTIRIPKAKVDGFLTVVSEAGNVTNRSESIDDVTLAYVDMESRKNALLVEQERLLAFMEQAENIDEVITLEDRLTNVRYQLESMESQLRSYDNKVDYATISMTIREVKELTPVVEEEETTIERIVNGFTENLKSIGHGFAEFFIWLLISAPYLILWAIIIFVIVVIFKAIVRKNRKKKAEKLAKMTAANAPEQKVNNNPTEVK